MVNQSFYTLLKDNQQTKYSLQKLCFSMDLHGPQYQIIFRNNYNDLKNEIENEDFDLEMITPINKIISDENIKRNILARLIHHTKNL